MYSSLRVWYHTNVTNKFSSITVVTTRRSVGVVVSLKDSIWTSIGSQTPPTKLVFATTSHMVTPPVLFHSVTTAGTATKLLFVFQQLRQTHFLRFPSVRVILFAGTTAVPFAIVGKAGLETAGVTSHYRGLILGGV